MAESNETKFLEFRGRPLVRSGNTIYYGNMKESYVVCINVIDEGESIEDIKMSGKVSVQLLSTDDTLSIKDKVIKKSEKQGLFNALDLGAVWLERALKIK